MTDLPPTFVKGFHDDDAVRKMKYHRLGKTDLIVSQLSLGGAAFCPVFGEFDEEDAIETIRLAIRSGINYIDTAPFYGQGRSEQFLGKALKGVPRNAYYIATKVGRYELPPKKQFDFSAAKTLSSIDVSLSYLGLDSVDVIQIHDIEFAETLDEIVNETLPALEQIVKEGKAKYIGVTGYPLEPLKEVISRSPGRVQTVLSYTRYTMLDNSLLEYLPFFEANNVGVICASNLAMGLLTNGGPQPWHPAHDETEEQGRQAAEYCKHRGIELGKLSIYYAMQLKGPATFLVGFQNQQQLQSNLDAFYHGLTETEHAALEYILKNICAKKGHWEGVELKRFFNR